MNDILLSQQNAIESPPYTLALPPGHLGVHFSSTVPTEICRIEEESPLFDSSIQFIGRLAYHLSIPNIITITGALDNVTLETILAAYSHVPDRKLTFKHRSESSDQGIITTTILPKGPITASFQCTRGFFRSRDRVYVASNTTSGSDTNYQFPAGHYVQKIIIPNHLVLEGGLRSTEVLYQTLNRFSDVPNRKIVFQKDLPTEGLCTRITLPKGSTGIQFYADFVDTPNLPVISLVGSSALLCSSPLNHTVKELIIPNEIKMERMLCRGVEKALNDFSEVAGRVLVLQEFRRDISSAGAKVTVTLPIGKLGLILRSYVNAFWVARIKPDSRLLHKIPMGYYVESLIVPGELELIGVEEMKSATYLSEKLNEFAHVSHRVLVLKQYKHEVQKRHRGLRFKNEFV